MKRLVVVFLVMAMLMPITLCQGAEIEKHYADIDAGKWYGEPVAFVTEKNLMNGTGNDQFSPDAPMTLQMILTVLYRTASQEYGVKLDALDRWYEKPGFYIPATLSNQSYVSREQCCSILFHFCWKILNKEDDGEYMRTVSITTDDVTMLDDQYLGMVKWAISKGIILGDTNNCLNPKAIVTRAEFAAMMQRLVELDLK